MLAGEVVSSIKGQHQGLPIITSDYDGAWRRIERAADRSPAIAVRALLKLTEHTIPGVKSRSLDELDRIVRRFPQCAREVAQGLPDDFRNPVAAESQPLGVMTSLVSLLGTIAQQDPSAAMSYVPTLETTGLDSSDVILRLLSARALWPLLAQDLEELTDLQDRLRELSVKDRDVAAGVERARREMRRRGGDRGASLRWRVDRVPALGFLLSAFAGSSVGGLMIPIFWSQAGVLPGFFIGIVAGVASFQSSDGDTRAALIAAAVGAAVGVVVSPVTAGFARWLFGAGLSPLGLLAGRNLLGFAIFSVLFMVGLAIIASRCLDIHFSFELLGGVWLPVAAVLSLAPYGLSDLLIASASVLSGAVAAFSASVASEEL